VVAVAVAGTSMATAMTMRMQRTTAVVMATTMPGRKNASSVSSFKSTGLEEPRGQRQRQQSSLKHALRCAAGCRLHTPVPTLASDTWERRAFFVLCSGSLSVLESPDEVGHRRCHGDACW